MSGQAGGELGSGGVGQERVCGKWWLCQSAGGLFRSPLREGQRIPLMALLQKNSVWEDLLIRFHLTDP